MIPILFFAGMCLVVVILLWFALCFREFCDEEIDVRTELLKVIAAVLAAVFSWFNTLLFSSGSVGETTSRVIQITADESKQVITSQITNTSSVSTYVYETVNTAVQNNMVSAALIIASFAISAIAVFYAGSCLYDLIKNKDETYVEDI